MVEPGDTLSDPSLQLAGAQGILEAVGMATFALDRSYRYLAFNSAHAAEMRALCGTEIALGGDFPLCASGDGSAVALRSLVDRALAGEQVEEHEWFGPAGYRRRQTASFLPIHTNGHTAGVAVTVRRAPASTAGGDHPQTPQHVILNALGAPAYVLDRSLRYVSFNAQHAEGMREQWNAHINVGDFVLGYITQPEQRALLEATYARVLAGETVVDQNWFGTEAPRYWTTTTAPLVEQGAVSGIISTAIDTTTQALTMEQLEEKATHDALTGVLNRPALERQIDHAIKLADRGSASVFGLLDVDGFKAFNDTRGHAFGDRVLVAIADALTSAVRAVDVVARLSGDEFGVLLVGWADGDLVAERARLAKAIRDAGVALGCELACSMGFARIERDAEVASVMHEADTAMYCEKRAHRVHR